MRVAVLFPLENTDAEYWGQLGDVIIGKSFLEHPQGFDLLTLAGGADVEPSYYGHPNLQSSCNPSRDHFERRCIEVALENGIPVAGICRGLQILAAHLGGTLVQDLGMYAGHGQTKVEALDGEEFPVVSDHHQMVVPSADGIILAWNVKRADPSEFTYAGPSSDLEHLRDEDGEMRVIQAVAWPEHRVFGCQFHPEWAHKASRSTTWVLEQVQKYCVSKKAFTA